MRKILSKWNLILFGLFACLVITFGVSVGVAMQAHAESEISNSQISEVYDFGTSLPLPTGAMVDGKEQAAEAVYLTYPNGVTTSKSPSILNQAGEYELQYVFSISGKTVRYSQRFKVAIPGFSYSDPKSSVEIGVNDRLSKIGVGAQIRLVNRDSLTFREIVDLSDNTADSPFLTLYALPQTVGEADAAKVKVRITDLYDAENYVDIYIKSNAKEDVTSIGASYLTAGANGQPSTGLEDNTASNSGVNVRQNDQFGFPAVFSLAGARYSDGGVATIDEPEALNLYFDYESKQILTDPSGYCSNARLIADLDDTSYFSNPWKGFTTGEVRISIMGLEYQTSALNLVVTELDGKLPSATVTDGEKPAIKVETDAFSSGNLPFARVGERFPIFPATAFDAHDGSVEVVSMVFYNYASSNPINCNTTSGSFVPTRPGLYTIVYQAKDLSGNVAVETVDVHAYANASLEIDLTEPISSTKTGESVELVKVSTTSSSGQVRYFISVADSDGNVTEVDAASRLFTPMKVGSYVVAVTARDYVSEVTETFSFEATENAIGKIFDEADIPRAFLKGVTYTLPTVYGYDFSSGIGVRKEAQIYIREDGGESVPHSGNTYLVQASSEVTIEYAITVNGSTDKKAYTVPVVDAGFGSSLDQAKLFRVVSGQASGMATSSTITGGVNGVSYVTSTDRTTLEFINSLQAVEFNLSFLIDSANHAFSGIHVTLTDALNSAESVLFSFEKVSGKTVFSVNDGIRYDIDASFEGATRTSFLVNYSAATKSVQAANNLTVSVQTYANGRPFEGFSSNFVYLQVEYAGVSGSSAIIFQNLNGHSFRNVTTDRYAPQILVTSTTGNRNKGDVVSLSGAVIADVIDAAITCGLTVTGPNGQPITAIDGTVLKNADPTKDYQFVLNEYGNYLISYTASDSTGNENSYAYNIAAVDQTPPVISIVNPVTSGKVGSRIAIASVKVTDDVTANCKVFVFVEGSNGSYELITDNYFIPKSSGEYRVRYLAMDDAGCCAIASYTVTVQ